MRWSGIRFGRPVQDLLFRRAFQQQPDPPLKHPNLLGLGGDHVGKIIDRPRQMGNLFLKAFDPIHVPPACPPGS